MKLTICLAPFAFGILLAHSCLTQSTSPAAASKPANATGQCKDGTFSTDPTKSGACRGHHGVKEWYTAAAPAPKSAAARPAPAAPAAQPAAAAPASPQTRPQPSAPAPSAAAASPKKGPKANLAGTPTAPGGGPGLVWVNTASNVYHCPGTDFYGKTKAGGYMSEAAAKSKGARPDHGKACTP